jgi:hypothetical protein
MTQKTARHSDVPMRNHPHFWGKNPHSHVPPANTIAAHPAVARRPRLGVCCLRGRVGAGRNGPACRQGRVCPDPLGPAFGPNQINSRRDAEAHERPAEPPRPNASASLRLGARYNSFLKKDLHSDVRKIWKCFSVLGGQQRLPKITTIFQRYSPDFVEHLWSSMPRSRGKGKGLPVLPDGLA